MALLIWMCGVGCVMWGVVCGVGCGVWCVVLGVHADGGRVSDAIPRPLRTTKRAPLVVASGVVGVPSRFRHMGTLGHTLGYSHEKKFF